MRHNVSTILGRVVAVVTGLLLVGLILRLMVAILAPVLPDKFAHDLSAGFNLLYDIVSPSMAAIMAVVIIVALVWVITGKRG